MIDGNISEYDKKNEYVIVYYDCTDTICKEHKWNTKVVGKRNQWLDLIIMEFYTFLGTVKFSYRYHVAAMIKKITHIILIVKTERDQTRNSRHPSHNSPSWASYGVSIASI